MKKKNETAIVAKTDKKLVKIELFMMLSQLKGARECANLYLELPEHPDDELRNKMGEAQEKIDAAMNDVACVIGWEVMHKEVMDKEG